MNKQEYEQMKKSGFVWVKNYPTDKISWKRNNEENLVFRFDNQPDTEFYLFSDYPWKLTPEQKEVFDRENPFWADFFSDRSYDANQNNRQQ